MDRVISIYSRTIKVTIYKLFVEKIIYHHKVIVIYINLSIILLRSLDYLFNFSIMYGTRVKYSVTLI